MSKKQWLSRVLALLVILPIAAGLLTNSQAGAQKGDPTLQGSGSSTPKQPGSGERPNRPGPTLPIEGPDAEAIFDPGNWRGPDSVYKSRMGAVVRQELISNAGPGTDISDSSIGNGNFTFSVPLLNLNGRGLDVSLGLTYKSRLWTKSGNTMYFDGYDNWLGAGWTLGFPGYGKLVEISDRFGVTDMLVDSDGTPHPYLATPATEGSGDCPGDYRRDGRTTDGTLIDYYVAWHSGGRPTCGKASYPDGTVVTFGRLDLYDTTLYPTSITDRSGNSITINYLSEQGLNGPNISSIVDTLGRTITFHYDNYQRFDSSMVPMVTAITAPGLNGAPRPLVRFNYRLLSLSADFADPIEPNYGPWDDYPGPVWVMDKIYYPGDQTGYWFAHESSYSSYGMLRIVSQQRAMSFTGSDCVQGQLCPQGTINPGITTLEQIYDYPSFPDPTLRDAPTYAAMSEAWEGMNTGPELTFYAVEEIQDTRVLTVTQPDGTRSIQSSYLSGNLSGRVYRSELRDSNNNRLKATSVAWEIGQDFYGSPRPARIETIDELGLTTAVEYTYGANSGQVIEERKYSFSDATHSPDLLKRVRTDYVQDLAYAQRHIFNLPREVRVDTGDPNLPVSVTEFSYDQQGANLDNAPGVVQYDRRYDPNYVISYPERCYEEPTEVDCQYNIESRRVECDEGPPQLVCTPARQENRFDPLTFYRGNVSQVTTYANAAARTTPIVQTNRYDITGNLVSSTSNCCQQVSYGYTAQTQYALPSTVTRGSADPNSPARLTTTASYNIHTGLVLSTTDPNGQFTDMTYDPVSLRLVQVAGKPAGAPGYDSRATTSYDYAGPNGAGFVVTQIITDDLAQTMVSQSVERLNGRGQVRQAETRDEGGLWNIVDTEYDTGPRRVMTTTRPYRNGETPQRSLTFYDALGRVERVVAPDGSESRVYFNETARPSSASAELGHTVRTQDAWGRESWSRTDALGLLVEVVEPNPDGTGSIFAPGNMVTSYLYDGNDYLIRTIQGVQQRVFRYDSLGRMTHQHLPERQATLNDTGGPGNSWSDFYTYDEYSRLVSHTDALGVRADFNYNGDPLNRLQLVSYANTFNNPNVVAVDPMSYQYVGTGDVTRIRQVSSGSGASAITELYDYDNRGRMSRKTTTFASRPAYPQVIDYSYDGVSRLQALVYPAEYGIPGDPRKVVYNSYDAAGRLNNLQVAGVDYISSIIYNAASQATSITIGASGTQQLQETYQYEQTTGLLANQQVLRAGNPLLNLSYNYVGQGTNGRRTGQLTGIINNLVPNGSQDRTYQYDALGRLTFMQSGYLQTPPVWTQGYSYDRYGNRTSVIASGTVQPLPQDGIASLSYNPSNNRITTPGFEYDAAGNLTRGQRADGTWQRYQYDTAGRLVAVRTDSGLTQEAYVYGAGRERLIAQGGESTAARTYYAWSGGAVFAEYVDIGSGPRIETMAWSRSYIYMGGRLLATLSANGTSEQVLYHHSDRLGTRLITSASDTRVWEQETLPFGVALQLPTGSKAGNRVFTSYDRSDATGVDYAMNRWYDSQLGRFTQVDPIGMAAASLGNPQSLNMYSYVGNDPSNKADPSGLVWAVYVDGLFSNFLPGEPAGGPAPGGKSSFYRHIGGADVKLTVDTGYSLFRGWLQYGVGAEVVGFSSIADRPNEEDWFDTLVGDYGLHGALDLLSVQYQDLDEEVGALAVDWEAILYGTSDFAAGFGDAVSFGLSKYIREEWFDTHVVDYNSGAYFVGDTVGEVHRDATLTLAGLRAGAALGGTRAGHFLNHNRILRVGPGRMPANGRLRAGPHVPRLSIGPQRPGYKNPHLDLRIRPFDR